MHHMHWLSSSKTICILGASGALGNAFTHQLLLKAPLAQIYTFSRHALDQSITQNQRLTHTTLDYFDEPTLASTTAQLFDSSPIDMIICTNGVLHTETFQPEKSISQLTPDTFMNVLKVNTLLPLIAAKYFLPYLQPKKRAVFAALSARVGSISDNELGGWYSYRASKAALNMSIKTLALEARRKYKHAIILGLHPGTVDSALSKPFQKSLAPHQLFTPEASATKLLSVIEQATPEQSGQCLDYKGIQIQP